MSPQGFNSVKPMARGRVDGGKAKPIFCHVPNTGGEPALQNDMGQLTQSAVCPISLGKSIRRPHLILEAEPRQLALVYVCVGGGRGSVTPYSSSPS